MRRIGVERRGIDAKCRKSEGAEIEEANVPKRELGQQNKLLQRMMAVRCDAMTRRKTKLEDRQKKGGLRTDDDISG
jgi:hypothetical protein